MGGTWFLNIKINNFTNLTDFSFFVIENSCSNPYSFDFRQKRSIIFHYFSFSELIKDDSSV